MTDEHRDERVDGLMPTRRILFSGLGALGVAVALAGCGSSDDGGDSKASGGSGGSGDASSSAGGDAASGTELVRTSEVPEGGGVILTDKKIVVTQPKSGEFKAFTAVCTHQGFTVTSVEDDIIHCNHHGSEYSASTGQVKQGPATAALSEISISVKGDSILAA